MAKMNFLRKVLNGKKKLLKVNKMILLPKIERFKSLSVENMLEYCCNNLDEIFNYLPDDPQFGVLDRGFLLNVSQIINSRS